MSTKKHHLVTARKQHCCELCGLAIDLGEPYSDYHCLPWDGINESFGHFRLHRFCVGVYYFETDGWDNEDFWRCNAPDILYEYLQRKYEEWGIAEEMAEIRHQEAVARLAELRAKRQARMEATL